MQVHCAETYVYIVCYQLNAVLLCTFVTEIQWQIMCWLWQYDYDTCLLLTYGWFQFWLMTMPPHPISVFLVLSIILVLFLRWRFRCRFSFGSISSQLQFWRHFRFSFCARRLSVERNSYSDVAGWLGGWVAGWLSHSCIVSKRLKLSENFFDHLKAPSF